MTHGTVDSFCGVRVTVSEYALIAAWKVEALPIKKRRRGYRVVCKREPGAYQLGKAFGGGLVVHPEIYARLKANLEARNFPPSNFAPEIGQLPSLQQVPKTKYELDGLFSVGVRRPSEIVNISSI